MTSMRLRITASIFLLALTALFVPAAEAAGRWVHLGPFGGPVSDIAIAPTAHRTLYAATVSGVYRSDDAGARWRPVRQGLPQYVGALAVDPTDLRTVYVSVLVREAGAPSLYKTVDGGTTWAPLDLEGVTVEDIAIDPRDPSTLLAAADGGLFRSEDAGATWDRVGPDQGTIALLFESVAFAPETPGVAYAASDNRGFFKSTDGGRTWTAKNEGLPAGAARLGLSSSGALYVTPGNSSGAVYRSLDQGESWTLQGSIRDQAIYALAVSADGSVVYAGTGRGIYRKNATGPGWTALRPEKREEIRALAVDPEDDGTLYAGIGTYGGFRGVLKSTDAGATWRQANRGLGGNPATALAIAPSNPRVLYVAFTPWNIARSADGGATWRDVSPRETRIFELAVDPRNENVVYAVGEYGQFWRSTNGGRSWTFDEIEDGQCVSPTSLTLDPRDPDRLLLAGFNAVGCERGGEDSCHVLQSMDRGRDWTCLEGARDANYFSLLADPRRSATLFAGGVGGFFKSTDGGQVWTPSNSGLSGGVLTLAASPNGTLWAGGASVWRSRNGGATWRPSGRGLPTNGQVRTLLAAPSNASVLYALVSLYDPGLEGLAYDIYVSSNAGAAWRRVPERGLLPLDYFEVWAFQVDPRDPGRLYIGTALGLFRLDGATE
jgi:photosystem II stability/assembly factor-like uncharacterized protein